MAFLVQKYGGTSLGDLDRIAMIAERVTRSQQKGDRIVVVVSAMAGETDRLIQLARTIEKPVQPREYSQLVSTGEQVSAALLAMALMKRGCKARSYTGAQAGIVTEPEAMDARIDHIDTARLQEDLDRGIIPVVTGFQGCDEEGNITTLGRGGSDTTAVALAVALKADACHIYTDVDGVYTADPRIVPQACRLERVTFEEMLELAGLGAKVLQIRSVEFASKYNMPLHVYSSFLEGPGTVITNEESMMERPVVTGVAYNQSEAKITVLGVPDRPLVASRIVSVIGDAGIGIDMIIQNMGHEGATDFTFTVHRDDLPKCESILRELLPSLGATEFVTDPGIAKLSVVGVGMRSHAGIAQTMFSSLGKEGINIQMIATSEIKVSVVVDEKYIELGVRALHAAFGLEERAVEEFDPRHDKK